MTKAKLTTRPAGPPVSPSPGHTSSDAQHVQEPLQHSVGVEVLLGNGGAARAQIVAPFKASMLARTSSMVSKANNPAPTGRNLLKPVSCAITGRPDASRRSVAEPAAPMPRSHSWRCRTRPWNPERSTGNWRASARTAPGLLSSNHWYARLPGLCSLRGGWRAPARTLLGEGGQRRTDVTNGPSGRRKLPCARWSRSRASWRLW